MGLRRGGRLGLGRRPLHHSRRPRRAGPRDAGTAGPLGEALVAAVRAGDVPEAAIDDKVRRLLRLAFRVGALDPGLPADGHAAASDPAPHEDHGPARALLRRAVAAGTVLLRNEDSLLPLDPSRLRRVAVLGPNAAAVRIQGGGSAGSTPLRLDPSRRHPRCAVRNGGGGPLLRRAPPGPAHSAGHGQRPQPADR
ncbi:glycoside hydrolase family 3 C-terminal domain-containing protein [Streptosporangium lutulentum]